MGKFVWAFGHANIKPAWLIGDAAYGLRFGRFDLSFLPGEREARFDVEGKASFSKLEKGLFQKRS